MRINYQALLLLGLFGTASHFAMAADNDVQGIKVNTGTIEAGIGNNITLKGNPMPLRGRAIRIGEPLPEAMVTGGNMAPVNIAAGNGKVRIISVVP
ncbi:MAG: hypothetical protein ABL878_02065, partial [Burkholderiales bacterium]